MELVQPMKGTGPEVQCEGGFIRQLAKTAGRSLEMNQDIRPGLASLPHYRRDIGTGIFVERGGFLRADRNLQGGELLLRK